jgi:hypothetical protein
MASNPRLPGQGVPGKEPLFSGHRSHADLVEEARLGWGEVHFGSGVGLLLQALLYLFVLAAALLLLWWAFAP